MRYEWDEAKAVGNHAKHGVAFDNVKDFEWESALVIVDSWRDYRESRLIAVSTINKRLHVLVYTQRGYTIRVISLRKANEREFSNYEKASRKT